MKSVKLFCIFSSFLLSVSFSYSDTLRISQIDNTSLLINQKVKVYISVISDNGDPVKGLTEEHFTVYESTEEAGEQEREIHSLQHGVNINQGINLLLIIDNSGSMYWDDTGKVKNSSDEEIWRITDAKEAVLSLLREMKNPLDRIGLVSFNVKIDSEVVPTDDKVLIAKALNQIKKPSEEEAYTELYETLYHSIDDLRTYRGRRAIVVLSDGVNFPMENNPYFPDPHGLEGAVKRAQKEGISVFTIGLGKKADRKSLRLIARETGGAYFSIYDADQIGNLYYLIRNQILNEYLLTYSAGMEPDDKKLVRIRYENDGISAEAQRFYFSETLFGFPQERFNILIFIFIPVSVALLWLLSLVKFEKKEEIPTLNVIRVAGRKKRGQTLVITPRKRKITIGGREEDDLTITGDATATLTEAVIDCKKNVYTIKSSNGPITVNNRPVKKKILRSGDLIRVGDTTVVFDGGVKKGDKKRKK